MRNKFFILLLSTACINATHEEVLFKLLRSINNACWARNKLQAEQYLQKLIEVAPRSWIARYGGARGDDVDGVLHDVIYLQSKTAVEALLNNGFDVNDHSGRYCVRPLHAAACMGNIEIAQLLINRGASINCTDNRGRSPLLEACVYRNKEMVNLLLKNGAEIPPNLIKKVKHEILEQPTYINKKDAEINEFLAWLTATIKNHEHTR